MIVLEIEGVDGWCWIEHRDRVFWVFVRDGRSARGPFATKEEAEWAWRRWCA